MSQIIDYATPVQGPPRGGLIAMGVIAIVIGALAGCMTLMMPVALMMTRLVPVPSQGTAAANPMTQVNAANAMNVASVVMAMGIYALVAAGFIWGGIGSIRCRRWVRPLALAIFWPSLVMGILASVMMVAMASDMAQVLRTPTATGGPLPPGAMIGAIVGAVIVGVMYIGLPAAFLVFYGRKAVRATLEFYDPLPRWTDRCPVQVLGIAVWCILGGCMMLMTMVRPVVPAFGTFLVGVPGAAVLLVVATVMAVAGLLVYRMSLAGWWMALAIVAAGGASGIVTFVKADLTDLYRAMGMPPQQIEMIGRLNVIRGPMPVVMMAASMTLVLAYVVYARRFFVKAVPDGVSPLP